MRIASSCTSSPPPSSPGRRTKPLLFPIAPAVCKVGIRPLHRGSGLNADGPVGYDRSGRVRDLGRRSRRWPTANGAPADRPRTAASTTADLDPPPGAPRRRRRPARPVSRATSGWSPTRSSRSSALIAWCAGVRAGRAGPGGSTCSGRSLASLVLVVFLFQYHCLDCGATGRLSRWRDHACDRRVAARRRHGSTRGPDARRRTQLGRSGPSLWSAVASCSAAVLVGDVAPAAIGLTAVADCRIIAVDAGLDSTLRRRRTSPRARRRSTGPIRRHVRADLRPPGSTRSPAARPRADLTSENGPIP